VRAADPDVQLLQAMADPVRLSIVRQLAAGDDAVCACDFTECCTVSQPTVSHHLKVLREAGREYTTRTAALLLNVAKDFEQKMEAEGAKVSRMSADERRKWANSMPNIALAWVERNEARGLPARKVLTAYMQKLRENNVELVRDWDKK
jgi:DNA-binding transcriptional ArsR family regulator